MASQPSTPSFWPAMNAQPVGVPPAGDETVAVKVSAGSLP
jgi:hypothetical protein